MKNKVETKFNFIRKILPFVFAFIIIILYHFLTKRFGDEIQFSKVLNNRTIINYLIFRYNNWTSRLIIEFFLVIWTAYFPRFVWIITDSIICILIIYYLYKIFIKKENINLAWIFVIIFLLYPFKDMGTAGYIATTFNYILPLFGIVYASYILQKSEKGEKIKIYEYILSILATFVGCNAEQSCLIFTGFLTIYFIKNLYLHTFNRKNNKLFIIIYIICIISLIFIITCPGNSVRKIKEIENWFPAFKELNFFQKLLLGITSIAYPFIQYGSIIVVFELFLMTYTIISKKETLPRFVSITSFLFAFCFILLKPIILNLYPNLDMLYNSFLCQSYLCNGIKFEIIQVVIILYILISQLYLLYILFKEKKYFFILLAGILSYIIMGFSPTIYASSTRTFIYLDTAMLILTFVLYQAINLKNKKIANILFYILVILAFFNIVNIIVGINTF